MAKNIIIGVLVVALIGGLGYLAYHNMEMNQYGSQVATTTTQTTVTVPTEPAAPTVVTSETVIPSNSTAAVTGQVTPNGAPTSYWYEYGQTTALENRTTTQAIGSGFSSISTPGYITGLQANTQYYFRLTAQNSFATVNGATYTFSTNSNPPPVVVAPTTQSVAATDVTRTTANLNGQINPNGYPTTYWFEYGQDASLGFVTAEQSAEEGTVVVPVGVSLSNLNPLTKYYFRLNAQNQYGTVNGTILSFTTEGPSAPGVPTVTTDTPNVVGTSTATFRGEVNPNGVETSYWFVYGTDPLLGSIIGTLTPSQTLAADTLTVSVKLDAVNLTHNTNYYYRLVAKNQYGTIQGGIVHFATKK